MPPSPGNSVSIVQTVTVNGVSVNVPRTITLLNPAVPTPGHDCANIIASTATLPLTDQVVSVNLGATGIVDVTLPFVGIAGEDCNGGVTIQRGIVVVPGTTLTILLHDVPAVVNPPTNPTVSPATLD